MLKKTKSVEESKGEIGNEVDMTPPPAKIAKLVIDLGREDMNKLVEKLNEVIEAINKNG